MDNTPRMYIFDRKGAALKKKKNMESVFPNV